MAGYACSYPTIRNSIGADLWPTDPVPTRPVWLRPNPACDLGDDTGQVSLR